MRAPRVLTAVALVPLAVLATGCDKKLEQSKLEKTIKGRLTSVGETPKSLDCPGDLKGKVGTKMICKLVTKGGQKADIDITVTQVKGSKIYYRIQPGTPTP